MKKLKIIYKATDSLVASAFNARLHSDEQINQIAESIKEFGFTNPVLIDNVSGIIAGHGRVLAARILKIDEVPCIELGHLSDRLQRAYILADNKIALNSKWDFGKLSEEVSALTEMEMDLSITGFNEQELDALLKNEPDFLPEEKDVVVGQHTRVGKHGAANFEDEGKGYKAQWGVIVICEDEAKQEEIYSRLSAEGLKCKIVVT